MRPFAATVDDGQHIDCVALYSVGHNVRGAGDHQLTCSSHAPEPPYVRKVAELADPLLDEIA